MGTPNLHRAGAMRAMLPVAGALIAAATTPAQAHLMNSGFGPFYDGLAHPLISPDDLLPALAVALLAGLNGAGFGRWVLATLPAAWLIGMAAGWALPPAAAPAWSMAAATALTGALVASDLRLPLAAVAGWAALLGALHGYGNGHELASTAGGLVAIAGIACSLATVVSLVAGQVAVLQAQWARLAVRISGSWIAAVGLLMFGWSMRM
jgi:hydrogenase/urease accessory protein HupE